MFERFTREARDATTRAVALAQEGGARSVESRHLLLSLLGPGGASPAGSGVDAPLRTVGVDPARLAATLMSELQHGGLDAAALTSVGIDLASVRERTDAVFGAGALERAGRERSSKHLPFTADAKKALEHALREAIRLHTNRIDPVIMLLGLLRDVDATAGTTLVRALDGVGSSVSALRTAAEDAVLAAS